MAQRIFRKADEEMKRIDNIGDTAWCSHHRDFHHISEFSSHSSRHNGLDGICRNGRNSINKKPLPKAKLAWRAIQERCLNKDGKHPSYFDVECRVSRKDFEDWYVIECEKWMKENPNKIPSVDRLDKHYEIGKIRIIEYGENSRIQSRNKNVHAKEGMAWCSSHQEYHPIEFFSKARNRINGLNANCKEITRKLDREQYQREKNKQ